MLKKTSKIGRKIRLEIMPVGDFRMLRIIATKWKFPGTEIPIPLNTKPYKKGALKW